MTEEHPPIPRISYAVARLERALRRAINMRVRPHGLTTLQYTTMSILGARPELSNAQLARRAYMTPQSMSEVIDALEKKGLIKRSPHPSHNRVYPATLTPMGRTVLQACDAEVDELERTMLGGMSPGEIDGFRDAILNGVRALNAGLPE